MNPGKLLATLSSRAKPDMLGDQLSFRSKFQEALKEITDALDPWSLTVIVDDLDRCRPEQVVDVLEAVNFLSASGGCFIVLGISLEQVTNAVGLAYEKDRKSTRLNSSHG